MPDDEVVTLMKQIYSYDLFANNPEWGKYFKQQLGGTTEDEEMIKMLTEKHAKARGWWARFCTSPLRSRIYSLLSHPESGALAMAISLLLMSVILLNTVTFMIESVPHFMDTELYDQLVIVDYACLGIFTVEFLARLVTCINVRQFLFSVDSVIDLLAILPFYIELIVVGPSGNQAQQTRIVRVLRLLRILRVLKAAGKFQNLRVVLDALVAAIDVLVMLVFLLTILLVVAGTIIYYIEQAETKDTLFDSIPRAMWWAQVTLTTVGYGDMAPQSPWGKFFAGVMMIMCLITLSLPISVVGGQFSVMWGKYKQLKDGIDRSGAVWSSFKAMSGGMAKHKEVMEDLVRTMQDMQTHLERQLADMHAKVREIRTELTAARRRSGAAPDPMQPLLARLALVKSEMAACQQAGADLDTLMRVAAVAQNKELTDKLDALHTSHKRLRDWADQGEGVAADAHELVRDLQALGRALGVDKDGGDKGGGEGPPNAAQP